MVTSPLLIRGFGVRVPGGAPVGARGDAQEPVDRCRPAWTGMGSSASRRRRWGPAPGFTQTDAPHAVAHRRPLWVDAVLVFLSPYRFWWWGRRCRVGRAAARGMHGAAAAPPFRRCCQGVRVGHRCAVVVAQVDLAGGAFRSGDRPGVGRFLAASVTCAHLNNLPRHDRQAIRPSNQPPGTPAETTAGRERHRSTRPDRDRSGRAELPVGNCRLGRVARSGLVKRTRQDRLWGAR